MFIVPIVAFWTYNISNYYYSYIYIVSFIDWDFFCRGVFEVR